MKARLIEDLGSGYAVVQDLGRNSGYTLMWNGKDVWRGGRWPDVHNARANALGYLRSPLRAKAELAEQRREERKRQKQRED
jgi:hypothetical protein